MHAIQFLKVVKALLAARADPSAKDGSKGDTARQWAAVMQHSACERVLAEAEETQARKEQIAAAGAKVDNPFDL